MKKWFVDHIGWIVPIYCCIALCITGLCIIPGLYSSEEQVVTQKKKDHEIQRGSDQYRANRFIRNLRYVKDSRTGLCFAIFTGDGTFDLKSAILLVPSESVPEELLVEGHPNQ